MTGTKHAIVRKKKEKKQIVEPRYNIFWKAGHRWRPGANGNEGFVSHPNI